MISAISQHQTPAPPPSLVLSPPLSGISICKMDLGTVFLDKLTRQHLCKSLSQSLGQISQGADRDATRQRGPFTWWSSPGPRAGSPEELAWKFSMAAKLLGAFSELGEGSPSLDFSSSSVGRSREGVGGPRTLAGECEEFARRIYLPQERAEEGGWPRGGARGEAPGSRRKPVCSRAGGAQSVPRFSERFLLRLAPRAH